MTPKVRWLSALGLIALATLFIYKIIQSPLWGYNPLWVFLCVWGAILLIPLKRRPAFSFENTLWAFSSGVLLAIGFPPSPIFAFLFIGFVPLLIIGHKIMERGGSRSELFRIGFTAFITWNIIATFWVANTSFISGIVAILSNSLLMCIPWVLYAVVQGRLGKRLGGLAFVVLWLAFEYVHMRWDLSWPWLTLGNGFAMAPSAVQWYSITGVFGGSLWVLICNFWIYKLIVNNDSSIISWLKPVALLVIPASISFFMYYSISIDQGEEIEVLVVQPNYEPHYQKFNYSQRAQVKKHLELTAQQISESTDFVLFPETAFNGIWHESIGAHPTIARLKTYLVDYPQANIITGMGSFEQLEDPNLKLPSVRTMNQAQGPIYYESYNSAALVGAGDDSIPIYVKDKLVPGAELMPYPRIFALLKPLIMKFGGTAYVLGKKNKMQLFNHASTTVGIPICYESVYGAYCAEMVRNGAEALFIITNDGWWDNTPGHMQHFHYARLRAVETRRSIARSANTGISGFINERGDILRVSKYDEPNCLKSVLHKSDVKTFYTIYGDLIGRVAGLLSILLLLLSFVRRFTNPAMN